MKIKHNKRPLRKIVIVGSVLVVLFLIAGTIYVYLADRSAKPLPAARSANVQTNSPIPKPVIPGVNDPEGVSLDALTTPVTSGSVASMSVQTLPDSTCTINVSYNGVLSKAAGLVPEPSNAYGSVSWTWTVDSNAPVGTWPVNVTCAFHGRTGVYIGNLQVTK